VLTGTVRWWKDEKGYGRITGDDGYVYFVHCSGIALDDPSAYATLRTGQRVEFRVALGTVADDERKVAESVRVLATEPSPQRQDSPRNRPESL
jgi:CspA family cold shock protein